MTLDELLKGMSALCDQYLAHARSNALQEVVELLDRMAEKARECGDATTAEVYELVRAKVQALAQTK